jgi:nucleoside-diphosphate-sugar epimerase
MAVLVTGASGFLGRRLAEILLARGERVRLLLRETSRVDTAGIEACEIIRCSFTDGAAVAAAMRDVRIVYHCAGLSSDWGAWADFRAANINLVGAMLAGAHQAGTVERFVHVSTTDIYGYPEQPCDEAAGFRDAGLPYNRSKGEGEALALAFHRKTGLPVTVVRPATIFGPRAKDWVMELSHLLETGQALTISGGRSPMGLVFVDDVADAMIALAGRPDTIGEAYNIVDPESMSWRRYMDIFADALGVRRPWLDMGRLPALAICHVCETAYRLMGMRSRPLFTRHLLLLMTRDQDFPIAKLRAAVPGFPQTGLAQGLERTLAWVEAQRPAARQPGGQLR